LVARLHHVSAEPEALRHQLGLGSSDSLTVSHLLLAGQRIGLKVKHSRSTAERLPLLPLPALALLGDGRVVVLAQCDTQRVLMLDPAAGGAQQTPHPVIQPLQAFCEAWTGELILVTSRASLAGELARFDFSWFIPSLVRHRKLIGEVLLVSLFLQLFALVTPLFFQVVMDKVLVHRGVATLDVLVVGLVAVVLFESVLNGLRSYVFTHTTSRIDVELGSRMYRHLLALPLAYFQARRVGDSVARVRELEHIRSFLTGNALTLLLDVLFSVVSIAVMLFDSVALTLIVLVSLPIYAGLSLLVVPVLRRRLDEKFARGAENQALLVESITGVQTVKAGALEPQLARRWDRQLAAYVVGTGDTTTEAAGAGTDTVMAGITWTLATNLENLTLTGSSAINATGNTADNVLIGNTGANTLSGLAGNDTYDGLAGNDALTDNSTTSNDIYRWGVGYGVDTITDSGGTDRVEFGAGITAAQLLFAHVGNNLEVTISGNSSDKLVVSSYYVGTANKIEDFRLSNGSSVPGGQLPASIVSRDTFAAGDDRELGPSRETIGPVAGRSSQLTAVGLPSRWPYLSKQSLSPTMRDSVEEIEPGAGRWMSFTAPGTLLQQVNVLLSAMAAFDVDSDAAMDTERQTVQPVHGRDVMWVSPAIS